MNNHIATFGEDRYIVTFKNEMTEDLISLVVSFSFDHEPRDVINNALCVLRGHVAPESLIFYTLQGVESI